MCCAVPLFPMMIFFLQTHTFSRGDKSHSIIMIWFCAMDFKMIWFMVLLALGLKLNANVIMLYDFYCMSVVLPCWKVVEKKLRKHTSTHIANGQYSQLVFWVMINGWRITTTITKHKYFLNGRTTKMKRKDKKKQKFSHDYW